VIHVTQNGGVMSSSRVIADTLTMDAQPVGLLNAPLQSHAFAGSVWGTVDDMADARQCAADSVCAFAVKDDMAEFRLQFYLINKKVCPSAASISVPD
jgi:hypothetical protein